MGVGACGWAGMGGAARSMGLVGSGVGSSGWVPKGGWASMGGAADRSPLTAAASAMTVASSFCSGSAGAGGSCLRIMIRWPHFRQVALLTSLTSLC